MTCTMNIRFCGAAREVTGSAHLITLENGFRLLLDCGLYQGNDEEMDTFNRSWLFDPSEIDCLILSHAHIDHSGRIPKLVKDGYTGNIYATHATRSLCAIMLLDSAYIQEREAEYETRDKRKKNPRAKQVSPLYTAKDVKDAMDLFVTTGYNRWVKLSDDVEVLFRDAGHILGSASVSLRIRENGQTRTIGFTGDIGRPDRPILRDPQPMPPSEILISESTYGDRIHESAPNEAEHFLRIIRETCLEKRGKLIIPAFSVGRTQEIVYMLDQLHTDGRLPAIPVYVDSPLAVNATAVFGAHPECYDNELNEYLLVDDNPFGFNSLIYARDVEISKSLNEMEGPAIIISSSGMMNAGRVKHHLANNIEDPKNTFLIVGYCAPGTPGAILRDGAEFIRIFGSYKKVRAHIEIMDSFSAHADKDELAHFLSHQRESVKQLFLVHGNYDAQVTLAAFLEKIGFPKPEIPTLGDAFEL
jgi:metallo-beta-lactamase family protein